ncbi:MAG: hypothetical protein GY754_24245 [bacterium]|nr:hypothetical protein [bacterium]
MLKKKNFLIVCCLIIMAGLLISCEQTNYEAGENPVIFGEEAAKGGACGPIGFAATVSVEQENRAQLHTWLLPALSLESPSSLTDYVVIMQPLLYNGSHPAIVTIAGSFYQSYFEYRISEWNYLDSDEFTQVDPVVISQMYNNAGGTVVVTQQQNVSSTGFEVKLQTEEAVLPFGTQPVFLAGMQTCQGGDTASNRYKDLTTYGVNIFIQEEQSQDVGYCPV